MRLCYLDHNATTPTRPEAISAMQEAAALGGNPSSIHQGGRRARKIVEDARDALAAHIGARPEGVIFVSGGTEANALALSGFGRRRVIAAATEHPSVLAFADEIAPVDADGLLDLDALDALMLNGREPALVAVMLVNNETGIVQPIDRIAEITHAHGALLHCDAAQAFGKIEVSLPALGCDSLSLSGHKIGAPLGVGALVLADPDLEIKPLIPGGGQERNRRSGTLNVPAIAGLGAVLPRLLEKERVRSLLDRLEAGVMTLDPGIEILGRRAPRAGNVALIFFPGAASERMAMAFDLDGVMVSSGSACSSGKASESHVALAMGKGGDMGAIIRVSLGWTSREEDVDAFLASAKKQAERRRPAA